MEVISMYDINSIFREYGESYRENKKLSIDQLKVMESIEACRTEKMNMHVQKCLACEHTKTSYNSCRNRHCPKCQNISKEEWVDARKSELMNTHYFHVVFTVPEFLNNLFYLNKKTLYNLLFSCASETLLELSSDHKYIGAQIGITTILHTWGQNLSYHPHLHCIVPGGGLSETSAEFKHSRKKFFLPVRVLSKKFRGKFLSMLCDMEKTSKITIPKYIDFIDLKEKSYNVDWVVYCKPPFKRPEDVISYLGRYTHRVAISNNRILSVKDDIVSFKWRDYKEKGREKIMNLPVHEFIRRFLMHVLPAGFFKIRHYGILSNRNKKTKLRLCQKLTGVKLTEIARLSRREIIEKLFGPDFFCCPLCGSEFISRSVLRE